MLNMRSQIDKIIITAMDRFVWFVLLVVMSHLVTEFTRVTGYARGSRSDVVLINDSMVHPVAVQNMVLYPGDEYGIYDQPNYYYNSGNSNNNNQQQANAPFILPNSNSNSNNNNNEQTGFFGFSFRPIIDSIFEIPISTLRAVNNLVGRLTGSFQQAPHGTATQKSAAAGLLGTRHTLERAMQTASDEEGSAPMVLTKKHRLQAATAAVAAAAAAVPSEDNAISDNEDNFPQAKASVKHTAMLREMSA